jgi:hypothetical protein
MIFRNSLLCFSLFYGGAVASTHSDLEERKQAAKLDLWSRGAFALDETALFGDDPVEQVERLEHHVNWASVRLGPIRETRRLKKEQCFGSQCLFSVRGGDASATDVPQIDVKIAQLGRELGPDFLEAIEQVRIDPLCNAVILVDDYAHASYRTRKTTSLIAKQAAKHTIVRSQKVNSQT